MKPLTFCLFIVLLCLTAKQACGQYTYDNNRPNLFYGSAKSMHGKTKVINCFISVGKHDWKKEDKQGILAVQDHGYQWIIRQGSKYWGVNDVSFTTSTIGLDNDIKVAKIERAEEPSKLNVLWVQLVLNAIGYSRPMDFYDSVKKAEAVDNVVVLVFAKRGGRSYAQPAYSDDTNNARFVEGAVLYSETTAGSTLNEATIVHEMLHLFGAWDLYNSSAQRQEVEDKARRVFPNSIMLDTHRDINPLFIDQINGWCIGWTKSYNSTYEFFRPAKDKKDKTLMKLIE